ncbi:transcription initiation factor TFIID subunit 9-like [Bidens hawaiensis]|uniref:transcription initiation factor TFIID subunit 9-like n=1 Tax=Bidens hawaiensis TaxID=980011 RepID=UPI00404ACE21
MAAGDDNLPRDAKTIIALLKSLGVESYEPRVVHQFLELYYRSAVDLITDAQTYSNHAGKVCIDNDDVMLAVKSRNCFSSTHPPQPEVKDVMKVNSQPIPRPPVFGPSLPPEWDMLIGSNYQIGMQSNQSSEPVEEQEVESNGVKIVENAPNEQAGPPNARNERRTDNVLPGTRQPVSFPLGLNRRR